MRSDANEATMESAHSRLERYFASKAIVMAMVDCADRDLTWSKHVFLDSGEVIVAKRAATGKQRGEIAGPGGWEHTPMSLAIFRPQRATAITGENSFCRNLTR